MNRSFLDVGGRNNNHRKKTTTVTGICSASGSDGIMNVATPCGDATMQDASPSVVEEIVAMECPVVNNPYVGPNPPLPTQDAIAIAGNAVGKPSYATATGKTSGKKVNVRTLYTPGSNGIDVVVPVDSIRAVIERFANTTYGFFLGKKVAYPVVANYVRNTWDAMVENGPWFILNNPIILKKWHPDENLLKEDVCTVPVWVKLHGVLVTAFSEDGLSAIATKLGNPLMLDSYTSDMCMQSWGRSSYARVMIELRADVELKDNIVVVIPTITREGHYTCNNTGAGEKKTVMKPSQTPQGISVGPKMDFKPHKEYRPILKNLTASSSGNKKKGVEPIIEVGNSNQFDVINSVDNDGEFGTNSSNTPIGEKIDKIERQICEGKLRLLDNDGNPLVPTGIVESDSEVEVVYDETANLRISTSGKDGSDKGYGTNSLLEQWRDSYPDNDDYDPYDDDMYENHDLSEHL
ncbi:nucleotide-diphospho-sugar transferase [Tanacetum coccineum]|uniref:Nucleotide-diphospho-sugar transferase n=1 Tax=Tanacetum coccineum TaxID=301880 RepID=A0ABQ4ZTN2_9ASTR